MRVVAWCGFLGLWTGLHIFRACAAQVKFAVLEDATREFRKGFHEMRRIAGMKVWARDMRVKLGRC